MTQYNNLILTLLSNHRQSDNNSLPLTLGYQQIISSVCHASNSSERTEISDALKELQAQGEVLEGSGNRYCIAPPTAIAMNKENLSSFKFQGDRAYLRLAHQLLKTEQTPTEVILKPQIRGFRGIQSVLKECNIRLVVLSDLLDWLPQPYLPIVEQLERVTNFSIDSQLVNIYVPKTWKNQQERWSNIHLENLPDRSLLKTRSAAGELQHFWWQDNYFYRLESESATMAMYALDAVNNLPLSLTWDEGLGRLNLQGVILPGDYASWLWRLSDPDPDRYRTRIFVPENYPLLKEAFNRLGCQLV